MPTDLTDGEGHTHQTRFRIPKPMWEAFGRVADRLGSNRTARLLDHVRADIREHGDERDIADLDAGDLELLERRSRKGGRPPQKPRAQ
ncbi:hypothetical protein [Acrocarpospora sp. B8E8]|uniref:hypothetical protein n=1 Tax=Acrocarpospora sp. B8E8 TaxID=3153572 RepID=UPI00325E4764